MWYHNLIAVDSILRCFTSKVTLFPVFSTNTLKLFNLLEMSTEAVCSSLAVKPVKVPAFTRNQGMEYAHET